MSTISSYILRQTMGPLLAAVGIALLVLLTERMLRLLDMVLDTGSGLTLLLQMLAFLVPHYMALALPAVLRSEEHTSELQSLMRISYAVFCLNKKIIE